MVVNRRGGRAPSRDRACETHPQARRLPARAGALALVALASLAGAAAGAPPGFAFLEIPAGARAAAMGGAYASVAEGVDAAFWNPAGLLVHGIQVAGSHAESFEKLRHDQFAVAGTLAGGGIAGSLRALYTEPIEERDDLGNLTGSFGGHDLELGLSYAHPLTNGLSLGGSAQMVRERIANTSAGTWAFGLGALCEPAVCPGLRLSLSAHNLGPAARFVSDGVAGEPVGLPAAVQAGASYGLHIGSLWTARAALENRYTRGRPGVAMLGGELAVASGAALRTGYRFNDDAASFSVGAGYRAERLLLDYAFVPSRLELEDTHRFSFTVQF